MSVGMVQAFQPAGTIAIAASGTVANGALPSGPGESVLVFNATAGIAFVRLDSTPAALTDTPVPAGGRAMLSCGAYASTASVILPTGSGTVYFTRGSGTAY